MKLLTFLVFGQYGLACKYGIFFRYQYIIGYSIAFLISSTTITQGCNKKFDSVYFLNKRCFYLVSFFN